MAEPSDRSSKPRPDHHGRIGVIGEVAVGAAAGAAVGTLGGVPGIVGGAGVGAIVGALGALATAREETVRSERESQLDRDVTAPDLVEAEPGVRWEELLATLDPETTAAPEARDESKEIDRAIEHLEQVRDELRVQAHLARLEARDAWEVRIAPSIQRIERDVASMGEATRKRAHAVIRELRQLLGA